MSLPSSIPRCIDHAALRSDPLAFLRRAQSAGDGLVVISEDQATFSRATQCAGAVAAFGPQAVRDVLTDADRFGMPVSIGERFSLPPRLIRLNFGLFSMRGEQHRAHQQLLLSALSASRVAGYAACIAQGWTAFSEGLRPGEPMSLLAEMRRLALNVSGRVILGEGGLETARLIQAYFDRRRNLKSTHGRPAADARRELIQMGSRLDGMLRDRVAALRAEAPDRADEPACLLAQLMRLKLPDGDALSDDELVGHANVLFMSGSEPIAVALTWTLLLLSQRPDWRAAHREEAVALHGKSRLPEQLGESDLPLLQGTVREALRLLPPNAIMVRLTTQSATILGHRLPEGCEVVVSPYVAHRDPTDYPDPDVFDPRRWRGLKPAPFTYFPFGVGARHCMGAHLARHVLTYVLARIVERFDVVLSGDQDIDWKMDITMMPASDPIATFRPLSRQARIESDGRLGGPAAALMGVAARVASTRTSAARRVSAD